MRYSSLSVAILPLYKILLSIHIWVRDQSTRTQVMGREAVRRSHNNSVVPIPDEYHESSAPSHTRLHYRPNVAEKRKWLLSASSTASNRTNRLSSFFSATEDSQMLGEMFNMQWLWIHQIRLSSLSLVGFLHCWSIRPRKSHSQNLCPRR